MKKQGTVIRWDSERGFGFIRSPQTSADIFFHIRDFRGADPAALRIGLAVTFEELHVGGKGPRAVAVQDSSARAAAPPARAARRSAPSRPQPPARTAPTASSAGTWLTLVLMTGYAAVLGWAVWLRHLPWWVLAASLLLNMATFFVYWLDKYAAQQRHWRTPEVHLHAWALAGGWGGAWWAQRILRHKISKESFMSQYWLAAIVHCAVVGVWLWQIGAFAALGLPPLT